MSTITIISSDNIKHNVSIEKIPKNCLWDVSINSSCKESESKIIQTDIENKILTPIINIMKDKRIQPSPMFEEDNNEYYDELVRCLDYLQLFDSIEPDVTKLLYLVALKRLTGSVILTTKDKEALYAYNLCGYSGLFKTLGY